MAFDTTTEHIISGQTFTYKGKAVKIVPECNITGSTVIVEDSFGNRFPVSLTDLKKNSLWNFEFIDKKAIERVDKNIAQAKIEHQNSKLELKESRNWLSSLINQFGTSNIDEMNSIQAQEFHSAKENIYACQSNKTATGNSLQSLYTHKFILLT